MLQAGGIKANGTVEVIRDEGPTMVLDGQQGIGAVIADRAMNLALDRAEKFGLSFVTVRNSNHFGIAGYFAAKSLERDMVGAALTNAAPAVAAWGGKTKVIGSNALAIAVPVDSECPIVLDFAIGASAAAKIFLAAERGERIPTDWMMDRNGRPTDDPSKLFAGGVLQPFGKHKGSGLGLIVDILTGVISGGDFSVAVRGFGKEMSESQGICHTFCALEVKRFIDVGHFKHRVAEIIRSVRASAPCDGVDRVYLPGEKSFLTRQEREKNGIPIWPRLRKQLEDISLRLSIESPFQPWI